MMVSNLCARCPIQESRDRVSCTDSMISYWSRIVLTSFRTCMVVGCGISAARI